MKSFEKKSLTLPLAALAATLAFGIPQARAEGLFDMLFRNQPRHEEPRGKFPPAPKVHRAVPVKRISSPTYNTYKADSLKKVDFAALVAAPQNAAFAPDAADSVFRNALGGLDGYDLYAEGNIGKALVAYYSKHPDFIWVTGTRPNARADEALRVLGEADSFGLVPSDYSVEAPAADAAGPDREKNLIQFEMALSARVLRYIHDAQNGRIDPGRISTYYDFPTKPLDLVGALNALAHTEEVRTYLESRHPQNPEFQALRVELEALEQSSENEIVVDPDLLLKPGETSAELPKLLTLIARNLDDDMGGRYGPTLAVLSTSETYTPELVPVIEAAQKKAGLKTDGVIGPRTVGALAGLSKADRLEKVKIAMEELRWLPSDLGSPRVFINQPAFTASYIEGGQEKLKTRVVIGRTTNQTSFFYDQIEEVVFHPYWGVPQSIIVNEMLPRLRRDPGYLDRAGYEVTDSKGRRIPSSSINWNRFGGKVPYNVRQLPSEANALGELKILFPNKHAIYMHDTPQKSFFKRDVRALSHGCVRLQDPRGMAAEVLGTSVDQIAQDLKGGHSRAKVTRKIPVYVAYFTAWPDMAGKVEYFNDIYGRDAHVEQAFEATEAVRQPAT
ncbi:L,D-transpeptidase family protein [Manganibacter manganicus]|uniref:L,D-TPase catalytic domain-containing protein n=1 Tax=Manganibacter manganicus TaxID=1873176 RepID=A0A1V8RU97_9HYPH|nr:murein L,D-transpeptidase [Pseudaminobacter manganicus]OQM76767.1 hypothetical protein BFN67_12735 [Pseudaminobacter manganicus]